MTDEQRELYAAYKGKMAQIDQQAITQTATLAAENTLAILTHSSIQARRKIEQDEERAEALKKIIKGEIDYDNIP